MNFTIDILSARYIHLTKWRIIHAGRSHWRLWWNEQDGAEFIAAGKPILLDPGHVFLVAPHVSISSAFLHNRVNHFFIHFLLGPPLHRCETHIHAIPVNGSLLNMLKKARAALHEGERHQTLALSHLISSVCQAVPPEDWHEPDLDPKFARITQIMENRLNNPIPNEELAREAGMATTAFVRRFSQIFGVSPQAYCMKKRLDQACVMLEYNSDSIDVIAEECGFCDRNHFTTTFRRKLNITPAAFRNQARD